MSVISGGSFEYIPQVDIGRVIEYGEGWLKDREKSLITLDNLYNINDLIRYGRSSNFREEKVTDTYFTLRWYHVPQSYLIELAARNFSDFVQIKDQLSRYLNYLKTVVYPTYRKSDQFIQWNTLDNY